MNMTRGKTAFLIVLLMGSSYYGYSKYRTLSPSAAINNGHTDDFPTRRERPRENSPEDNQRRQEFAKMLNLTPEQEAQMKALREQQHAAGDSGERGGRDRWTSFSQVLTPQQRSQMTAMRDARRDRGAKAALSGSDFQKYQEKRNQRRAANPGRPF